MDATFKRIIIAAIAFIAIAAGAAALVVSGSCSRTANPIDDARNGAVNAIIDISGIKSRIDQEIRTRAGDVASRIGVSRAVVDNVVDTLAIEDWRVTSLPASATETGTYSLEADSLTAQITTYDDPSVVTVDAYGQSITMEVPESARAYVPFIRYLEG